MTSALLACAACRSPGRWQYPRGLIEPRAPVALTGAPLQLRGRGLWDPAEQYWGEPEDTIAAPLAGVIAAGPRPQFEFEQLLPGGENQTPRIRSCGRSRCATAASEHARPGC